MSRSENQKLKLFRLFEILMSETDEETGISMPEIISRLADLGIEAERKSIYRDFEALEELGFSVIKLQTRPTTYTLDQRIFQLAELKLLVDAVQSSKFISESKSRDIITKLKIFAGKRGADDLSRQIYFENRVKTESVETLYAVDSIHKSINEGKILSFCYFDYTWKKEKVLRHGGERYFVAPKSLVWRDENYYLVGYDEKDGFVKNFRVDKMHKTEVEDRRPSESALKCKINPADYSNKIFGMYGGKEELVTLDVKERLSGAIIDRFGKNQQFIKTDFGFKVSLRVMVSPTFFAWVMSFGKDVRIISPLWVKNAMAENLMDILEHYK